MQQQDNLAEAWEALNGPEHIFLTGPAGSGKSTLIREYIERNNGDVIVCAPTGIAAINVGGVTIHNFFHFPGRTLSYNSIKWLDSRNEIDFIKIQIIKRAKAIVVDEASMVRADIMDQIAWFFHKNFPGEPFGGKKIILVGDVDQLPPVVKEEAEREMLAKRYHSPFFFSAHCWIPERLTTFRTVTLTKVWRQSDPVFINLLNDIKGNKLAPFEIDKLNRTCYREGMLTPEDGIMLCGTNAVANQVNGEMLARVEGEAIRLTGEVIGSFDLKNCIVEHKIDLKPGCKIMTMRNSNDPNNDYRNGSIGTFERQDEDGALIIKLDSGKVVQVGRYTFESIDYTYDKKEDRISHKITGQFLQYPVKVAYAISIHKSQGQTFDKVIIDMGERGAFAHGQVYVALSRCRTLEGIILRRPLRNRDIIYDPRILKFNADNAKIVADSQRVTK